MTTIHLTRRAPFELRSIILNNEILWGQLAACYWPTDSSGDIWFHRVTEEKTMAILNHEMMHAIFWRIGEKEAAWQIDNITKGVCDSPPDALW